MLPARACVRRGVLLRGPYPSGGTRAAQDQPKVD